MSLIAGFARADVTPPVGIVMAGYGSRTEGSIGIRDELAATALYLKVGEVEAAVVALDLIMARSEEIAAIRECCRERSGIPGEHILLSFSHTHAGPQMGPGEDDPLRAAYAECLRRQIAGAVSEAKLRAVPAVIGHGAKPARIAGNRRERTEQGTILGYNPEGPTPNQTDVLRFDNAETGATIGVLFQYACHGTTMGGENLWLSAEYQGVARRLVEQLLPGVRSMFVGGCGADQNPYPRGTFDWVDRHGNVLGAAVYQACLDIRETQPVETLRVHTGSCALPLQRMPPLEDCRAELRAAEEAAEKARREHAEREGVPYDEGLPLSWELGRRLRSARERLEACERGETELTLPVELQVIAIGDIALIGLPPEVFFRIGRQIAQRSPFWLTLPIDYANGAIGYIPTQDEVAFGGYEIETARARHCGLALRDDADSVLVDAAVEALEAAKG